LLRRLRSTISRPDVLISGFFFLLPLAFFWQVTLGGKTLIPADNLYQVQPFAAYREALGVPPVAHNMLVSDLLLENIVWKQFIRESLAGGELPLWNPYLFTGVPFLAAGQHSALYPFSLIYYALPLPAAYGWFTVSQLWLAGLFMYLFMRGMGVGRWGAVFAGVVFQLSGFFLISVVFQMIIAGAAWLPFLMLMVEFTLRREPFAGKPAVIPWVAGGAVGLGMTILAGHVEFVYYVLLVMGFWAGLRLLHLLISRRTSFLQAVQKGITLLALVGLGIGIGAVQFLPFLELAGGSFREGRSTFEQIRGYAFPPRHALIYLMPNLFGNPTQHTYFDVFAGETRPVAWTVNGATLTDTMMPGGKNYVEGAAYVGILTLFLAVLGATAPQPRPDLGKGDMDALRGVYRSLIVLLTLAAGSFTFGTITYALLYYGLPGFNQLHSPFRWVFPLTLCLAALAGFGVDGLRRLDGDRLRRWAARFGYAAAALGGVILAGLVASRLFYDRLETVMEALYKGLAGADYAYPSAEIFYSVKFRDVLIFALMLIGAGIVLILFRRRPKIAPFAAVTLIAADLVIASAGFNPAADPAWLDFTPPSIAFLQSQNPKEWRLTAVQGQTATLNANLAWRYGLQDIRGYDSIITRAYVDYMTRIQPQTQLLYNRIAPIFPDTLHQAVESFWLPLMGVRYLLSEGELPLAAFPQYRLVSRDEGVVIYENTETFPRAVLIQGGASRLANFSGAISTCWQLDESLVEQTGIQGVPAALTEAKNNQVIVTVQGGEQGGCLLLTDSYASGWRVYLRPEGSPESAEQEALNRHGDGSPDTPAPSRLFGNFRGVDIPPGAWTVRFRYSPPSFQIGAFTSFLAVMTLILMGMIMAWGRLRAGGEALSSGGRIFKNTAVPILLNLFNRGIDLAFALIMLRLLGPANAGTYYYAIVIFGWFDIFTNFGLNTLLTREVARDRASAGRYLLNSSLLRLGLAGAGIPLLIGFLAIRGALTPPLDGIAIAAILLFYVGLLPNSISTGLTALFYAFERAEVPAITAGVTAILKAGVGLLALVSGGGVIGLALVSILLNGITLIILGAQARSLPPVETAETANVDRALMGGMLRAGFPLMLNHFLATIFFKSDVVLLEALKGASVVGTYSTAYKWIDALGVIPSLFTMALLPLLSRQAVEDKAALLRTWGFGVKLLLMVAIPVAVVTTLLAYPLIGLLGGTQFLPDGAIALQLMIWFALIGWINSLTNYVLIALDQQTKMREAFFAGVSFNIIANLILIPTYSYRAAAVVTIFSELVLLVMFARLLRRAAGAVDWVGLLWRQAAAGGMMIAAAVLIAPHSLILAGIVSVAVYGAAFAVLRPFTAWEMERLRGSLPRRSSPSPAA